MKDINLLVEKIAGAPSGDYSCLVFNQKVNLPSGDLGALVGVILAKGETPEVMQTACRDVFDIFSQKLEISEEGPLETMQSAAQSARQYLEGARGDINFVFGFFFKEVCYIVRFGNKIKILVFEPPKSTELTFESGSGPVSGGELFLIATEKFLESFDTSEFLKSVDVDFGDLVDGLATDITAADDVSEIGAVFVYSGGREEIAEVVEEEMAEKEQVSPSEDETAAAGEQVFETEEIGEHPPKRLNLGFIAAFIKGVLKESGRLKRGDLGAVGRLRQHVLLLIILLVLVILASGGFTLWQKNNKARDLDFFAHMAAANSKFSEGLSLLDLNKSKARADFVDAQSELSKSLVIHPKDAGAQKLKADIEAKLKAADQSANISFAELASFPENVSAISFAGKNITAAGADKLYSVDTSSKSAQEIKGASGGTAINVFDSKAFILNGPAIFRQDLSGGTAQKIDVTAGGVDIGIFFGNIYVLLPAKIAKIVPIAGGYATETDYLSGKTDFLPSSRFAIDGSIWATKGDKILKFTRGAQENFDISGLSGKLGELGAVYTDGTINDLYVLDKTNSALLVIGKDGVYKKAFQASEFGRATDILVTDDESTLYISVDSKVLSASIK